MSRQDSDEQQYLKIFFLLKIRLQKTHMHFCAGTQMNQFILLLSLFWDGEHFRTVCLIIASAHLAVQLCVQYNETKKS